MAQSPKSISPFSGGFLHELALRIKLIFRLLGDSRVNPFVKLLPIGSVLYLLNPIDVPGPLDDAAVVGLGFYLFMEFCPADVVEEHLKDLRALADTNPTSAAQDENIVDGEFSEIDKN